MKTYGQYKLMPAVALSNNRKYWAVHAAPHVMARLKRIFPRVLQQRGGMLALTDTAEVARDLEWILERWPLTAADDESAQYLTKRAESHRASQEQVLRILDGERIDFGWRDPALPARDYQLVVPSMVQATGRLLLGDDVGLGKTVSSSLIFCNPAALPALVVTLTHLPTQWQKEINRFFPWLGTHIVTSGKPYDPTKVWAGRGRARRPLCERDPDVLIMSYWKLDGWGDYLRDKIRSVIFDEAQELRHDDTKRYAAASLVAAGADFRIGATATPVYNYGDEIHAVVGVLDPDVLGSKEEFKREWCAGDGSGRTAKVRDPKALGAFLRDEGVLLRRSRKEVGRELPETITVEQNVDTDPEVLERLAGNAADMAKLVLDKAANQTERWTTGGQLEMRMRHATGVAKAPFVAEFCRLLLESEERIVLWGWHRDVYDIWDDRLAEFDPVFYTGTESSRQKNANAQRFLDGESRILVMSLRSGAGLDGLQAVCRVGVFGELDWSPQVHHQAIGRLARDGQEDPVVAYYMVSDDGSDPPMSEMLNIKQQQSVPIMDPQRELFSISAASDRGRAEMVAQAVLRRAGIHC